MAKKKQPSAGASMQSGKRPGGSRSSKSKKSPSDSSGSRSVKASTITSVVPLPDVDVPPLLSKSDVMVGELPPEFDPLTPKQRLFVVFYAVTRKGVEAARMAGYAGDYATLSVQATENLRNPNILAAYDSYMRPQFEAHGITIGRILNELAAIGFSDIGEIIDFTGDSPKLKRPSEITPDARRSIQSMKVKRYTERDGEDAREVEITEFRFWNKNDAVVTLAKMLRLLGRDGEEGSTINQAVHFHLKDYKTANEVRQALLTFLKNRK